MRVAMLFAAGAVLITTTVNAQPRSPLEGVWKITEVVTTGANASTLSNPQPSLVIFLGRHYSYMSLPGSEPRPAVEPAKDGENLTDAEKIIRYEQWNPITANGGTFEIKGKMLTRRPFIAKNVSVMTSTTPVVPQEFRVSGNTLWLISKSAPGQPPAETRTRLTRVR